MDLSKALESINGFCSSDSEDEQVEVVISEGYILTLNIWQSSDTRRLSILSRLKFLTLFLVASKSVQAMLDKKASKQAVRRKRRSNRVPSVVNAKNFPFPDDQKMIESKLN
uniref:Uncharacterized protein n=1 Tax=Ditylenchus dipsaci TaxID=166011 RepID=A0A915CS16_9BILA